MPDFKKQITEKERALELAIDELRSLNADAETPIEQIQSKMKEVRSLQKEIEDLKVRDEAQNLDNLKKKKPDEKDASQADSKDDSESKDDEEPNEDAENDDKKKKKRDVKPDEEPDAPEEPDDPKVRSIEPKSEKRSLDQKEEGENQVATNVTKDSKKQKQLRGIENYVHSKGETRDLEGLTKTDIGLMVPKEIIYDPEAEVETVTDLSQFVTTTTVSTGSGTYPILKRATSRMNTVAELEENPKLAKPEFTPVDWKIDTYRGAIPISEESIQDSQVPVVPVIRQNAGEQRVNTLNYGISTVLKGFQAKTISADTVVDDIKAILNVDLDPAYNKMFIVTQSAYQLLDTLKDKEGRYLLHEDIASASGKTLLGYNLAIVNDDLLGEKAGDVAMWIGDMKRAVLFAKRIDTAIEWTKNEIYGQYLALVMRFGITEADKNAGYFVTLDSATTADTSK